MASNSLSYLDKLRLHYGIDELKSAFRKICNNQNKEAARLINDNKLSFASLFVLLPEIEEFNLYHDLNQRNIAAVKISAKVLKDKNITLHFDNLDINKTDIPYMEWMLKSGAKDDGLSKDFDKVLDAAALLLIITYKNKKIMPLVIDMIFKRNRKGAYIHDLVWALYNSHDLSAFKTIARYLYSENKKDIELGCKLLDLEPSDENNNQLKTVCSISLLA